MLRNTHGHKLEIIGVIEKKITPGLSGMYKIYKIYFNDFHFYTLKYTHINKSILSSSLRLDILARI